MSKQYLLKESRILIEIAKTPFAGGGEGDLYKIKSPAAYRNYVAKIYHPHKISKEREEKTEYLINHPPVGLSENGSIIWIKEALYTPQYQFAGFIMPFASGKKLELLCLGKLPKKIGPAWQRFDLKNPAALQYRMRICFNLAAAIYQMHATEHYVLVDMKPENILLQPNGLLAIVDTDSVEVIENDVAIFPAPVATPEYTPPEFYTSKDRKNTTVGESWDRFGLAVIFYKLLCGIHPFAGSAHAPYDNLVSLHEKIEHGLFVHRTQDQDIFSVIPPPHRQFEKLAANLQALFIQCFEEGHANPVARPTANEWCSALLVAIGDPALEAHFAHIMGLWGNSSRIKIEMPSALFRKNITTIHPKRWLEYRIEDACGSLPSLPIALHQAIESGKQQIKLTLEARDYQISWLFFLGVFLPVLLFTPLGEWFTGDFWLLEAWFINIIALILLLLPLILLPRLVSWFRHLTSSEIKARKLWNKFRLTYPELKRDVIEVKRVLSEKLLKQNKADIDAFQVERVKHETPLKKYLSEQDQKVKALMDARKDQLDEINQKYLNLAEKNQLLLEMKGRSVFTLNKRLKNYYQKKLKSVGQDKIQTLEYSHTVDLESLKEQDRATQTALMEEAMCIFDLNHFCEKHLNINPSALKNLKDILEEYDIKHLKDIKSMNWDEDNNLIVCPYADSSNYKGAGKPFQLTKETIDDLEVFKSAYMLYEKEVHYAQEQDINYGKAYFQEAYALSRKTYEKQLNALKEDYRKQRLALQQTYLQEQKQSLKEDFEVAKSLLEELIEREKADVEQIEEGYEKQYQVIYEESKAEVLKVGETIEGLNEEYKIEVNRLLATNNIEKIQLSMKEKIAQAKEDIITLEQLKF